MCIFRRDAIVNIYSELSSVVRRNSSIAGSLSEPHNAAGATIGATGHEWLLVQITTRRVEVPRVRYNFHGVSSVCEKNRVSLLKVWRNCARYFRTRLVSSERAEKSLSILVPLSHFTARFPLSSTISSHDTFVTVIFRTPFAVSAPHCLCPERATPSECKSANVVTPFSCIDVFLVAWPNLKNK